MTHQLIQHPQDPDVRILTWRDSSDNSLVMSPSISGQDNPGRHFDDIYDWAGDMPPAFYGDSCIGIPYFSGASGATEAESFATAEELLNRYQAHLNCKLDRLRELIQSQSRNSPNRQ